MLNELSEQLASQQPVAPPPPAPVQSEAIARLSEQIADVQRSHGQLTALRTQIEDVQRSLGTLSAQIATLQLAAPKPTSPPASPPRRKPVSALKYRLNKLNRLQHHEPRPLRIPAPLLAGAAAVRPARSRHRHALVQSGALHRGHARQRPRSGLPGPRVRRPGRRLDRLDPGGPRALGRAPASLRVGARRRAGCGAQQWVRADQRRDHGLPQLGRFAAAGLTCIRRPLLPRAP